MDIETPECPACQNHAGFGNQVDAALTSRALLTKHFVRLDSQKT